MNFKKGLTLSKYPELGLTENKALRHLQRDHHALMTDIISKITDNQKKRSDQGDFWWELRACTYIQNFLQPKIIFAEISKIPSFMYDLQGFFLNSKGYILTTTILSLKYMLLILNSHLAQFQFLLKTNPLNKGKEALSRFALKNHDQPEKIDSFVEYLLFTYRIDDTSKSRFDQTCK